MVTLRKSFFIVLAVIFFYQVEANPLSAWFSTKSKEAGAMAAGAYAGLWAYRHKVGLSLAAVGIIGGIAYVGSKVNVANLKKLTKAVVAGTALGGVGYTKSLYSQSKLARTTQTLLTKSINPQNPAEFRFFNARVFDAWPTAYEIQKNTTAVKGTIIRSMKSSSIVVVDDHNKQVPVHQVDSTKLKNALDHEKKELEKILLALGSYVAMPQHIVEILSDNRLVAKIPLKIDSDLNIRTKITLNAQEKEAIHVMNNSSMSEQVVRVAPMLVKHEGISLLMDDAKKKTLEEFSKNPTLAVKSPFYEVLTELYAQVYPKYLRLLAIQDIVNTLNYV